MHIPRKKIIHKTQKKTFTTLEIKKNVKNKTKKRRNQNHIKVPLTSRSTKKTNKFFKQRFFSTKLNTNTSENFFSFYFFSIIKCKKINYIYQAFHTYYINLYYSTTGSYPEITLIYKKKSKLQNTSKKKQKTHTTITCQGKIILSF
eukprot:TRINITY_DN20730_c0_g1_i1.p2 TRINITY_DN20730_c0_g1~~TRINITY_DN20730_c0_g1_i1.p2  ORF type:complete len:146 (+),score=4.16 TRINITY_DN20730_c0_g1_i1:425-862(+)